MHTSRSFWTAAAVASSATAFAQPPPPPQAEAPPRSMVSVIVGTSVPIKGLNYNTGIGIRVGRNLGRLYVGGMLAIHSGDAKSIMYGPVSALGIPGGEQTYDSTPIFAVGDVGYTLTIPIAGRATTLTPYLSLGLLVTQLSTDGVYGDDSISHQDVVMGGGASYAVPLTPRTSVGLHYRMYNVTDASFEFSGAIDHGFSTSIFYAAFYSELAYRF